jgi:putative flippase GtrA
MSSYHDLTKLSGTVLAVTVAINLAFFLHAATAFREFRTRQKQKAARPFSTRISFGFPLSLFPNLPLLLRLLYLLCSISCFLGTVSMLVINFIYVESATLQQELHPQVVEGLDDASVACLVLVKTVQMNYVAVKVKPSEAKWSSACNCWIDHSSFALCVISPLAVLQLQLLLHQAAHCPHHAV